MDRSATQPRGKLAMAADQLNTRYLFLSTISGFVELGAITYAVLQGWPVLAVLMIGCAYQAGSLVPNDARLPRYWFIPVLAVVTALGSFTGSSYALALAVLLLSIALQALREQALSVQHTNTLAKRISRILGFLASVFFSPVSSGVVALLVAGSGLTLPATGSEAAPQPRPGHKLPRRIDLIMVIHQAHYFAYAYAMPYLFLRIYGLDAVYAALAFALGWVSYAATPSVLARRPLVPTLVLGHLGVACILVAMATTIQRLDLLLVAWFLTGLGGGTVFMIRILERRWRPARPAAELDRWENIGHVLGVLVALGVTALFPGVRAMLLAGSALATVTAALILLTVRGKPVDGGVWDS